MVGKACVARASEADATNGCRHERRGARTMKSWTVDEMLAEQPCYTRERLVELLGDRERATLLEIIEDERIPATHRIWCCCRGGREFVAAWLLLVMTRCVSAHALRCGIGEIERWAQQWLDGKKDRSWSAAWAAGAAGAAEAEAAAGRATDAAAAAGRATMATAWVTGAAAWAAEATAARAAEAAAGWATKAEVAAWTVEAEAAAWAAEATAVEAEAAAWAVEATAVAAEAAAWTTGAVAAEAAERRRQLDDARAVLARMGAGVTEKP